MWMKKLFTTEQFIEKARMVHGDKYDYSNTDYKMAKEKVCIICPKHGEFWQTANSHLSGHGCKKCSIEENSKKQKRDKDEFIMLAEERFPNMYDYSNVVYECSGQIRLYGA